MEERSYVRVCAFKKSCCHHGNLWIFYATLHMARHGLHTCSLLPTLLPDKHQSTVYTSDYIHIAKGWHHYTGMCGCINIVGTFWDMPWCIIYSTRSCLVSGLYHEPWRHTLAGAVVFVVGTCVLGVEVGSSMLTDDYVSHIQTRTTVGGPMYSVAM